MFAADDSSAGLANLARFLRDNPTNRVAIGRLLSALSYRNFALPVYGPLKHDGRVTSARSEEHTSELQSRLHLVCRLLLEKKKKKITDKILHVQTNVAQKHKR